MTEQIKISIAPNGTVKIEPSGHKGGTCLEELKRIQERMKNLGVETELVAQKMTQEYYAAGTKVKVTATAGGKSQ